MSFDFKINVDRSGVTRSFMHLLVDDDTRDRLYKLCPEELSIAEMIRQILDNFVGIERPLNRRRIEAVAEEKLFLKKARSTPKDT